MSKVIPGSIFTSDNSRCGPLSLALIVALQHIYLKILYTHKNVENFIKKEDMHK